MTAMMDEGKQQNSDIEDKIMENNEAEKTREIKAKEHDLELEKSVTHKKGTTSEA